MRPRSTKLIKLEPSFIRDKNLSLAAKGLFAYLQSYYADNQAKESEEKGPFDVYLGDSFSPGKRFCELKESLEEIDLLILELEQANHLK